VAANVQHGQATLLTNRSRSLFPSHLLVRSISATKSCAKMELSRRVETAGGGVVLRPLCAEDRKRGIFDLLAQLTQAPTLSAEAFGVILAAIDSNPNHIVVVAEDNVCPGKLLGTAAVLVEQKLLRSGGRVGHIEDVVVDASARGRSIGKLLVNFLVDFSKSRGCYKVILDCDEQNVAFYERCGLEKKEVQMVRYF
jgi:glucosamine-phosphate N-acetyltransferase